MSLLTDGVMTEDEGFMLEAAEQCGMFHTDDDCEHMRGSIKALVLFGTISSGVITPEINAIVTPLIEQECKEWLAWYDLLPLAKPPYSGKDSGISLDSIIDDVLTLGSGDPEAALELLVEWRAGLA